MNFNNAPDTREDQQEKNRKLLRRGVFAAGLLAVGAADAVSRKITPNNHYGITKRGLAAVAVIVPLVAVTELYDYFTQGKSKVIGPDEGFWGGWGEGFDFDGPFDPPSDPSSGIRPNWLEDVYEFLDKNPVSVD